MIFLGHQMERRGHVHQMRGLARGRVAEMILMLAGICAFMNSRLVAELTHEIFLSMQVCCCWRFPLRL